ncbi:hypothetical protein ACLQ18_36105 [Streptomyces sp. DT193]|uniref:hypothetical protein n=1 Tax=Streptomyces sp. DT193 TaxID=3393418 RepID=UPI003CE8BFC5
MKSFDPATRSTVGSPYLHQAPARVFLGGFGIPALVEAFEYGKSRIVKGALNQTKQVTRVSASGKQPLSSRNRSQCTCTGPRIDRLPADGPQYEEACELRDVSTIKLFPSWMV